MNEQKSEACKLKPLNEIKNLIFKTRDNIYYYFDWEGILRGFNVGAPTIDKKLFDTLVRRSSTNVEIPKIVRCFESLYHMGSEPNQVLCNMAKDIPCKDNEFVNVNYKKAWKDGKRFPYLGGYEYMERVLTNAENANPYEYVRVLGFITEGISYDEVQYLFNVAFETYKEKGECILKHNEKNINLDIFLADFDRPQICRVPENYNKKTFDYIKIDVHILDAMICDFDRKAYIQKHINEIRKKTVEYLSKDKSFQDYGVPINFLKCTRAHTTGLNLLEFIFELKIE